MSKVFVEDKEETLKLETEPVKTKKPRKKRAPLTDEQKKALVERLKLAREKKKQEREKEKVVEKPKEKKKVENPPTPPQQSYRPRQHELEELRAELEIQKLKNDLEDARRPKKKSIEIPPIIKEETPNPPIKKETIVEKVEVIPPRKNDPPVRKKVRHSLIPKNIWAF